MDTDLNDQLLALANQAAAAAAAVLRDMQGSIAGQEPVTKENHREVVTAADLAAESVIVRVLRTGPEATIITEETSPDVSDLGGLCWIVDPLDGSSAYLHGLDTYTVSIAAWRRGRPVVAVVAMPPQEAMFHAVAGRGAYGPSGPLRVSSREVRSAVVSLGSSVVRSALAGERDVQRGLADAVTQAQGLRIAASCAQELALVAQGKVDLFFAARQRLWDYAAGILLVREAGGNVWIGSMGSQRRDVLASNERRDLFVELANQVTAP
jgi:myo-inositol-1(or 4)-monophosphatase